ncbi:acyl-CoA dehydrogenase family protein [Streptomyces sp. NBC_00525]|uniref:acyl-CoA dehydrogenase family protein n=1 Tax=Streptomyces sp. NBC_00525 TaxID=2903660 RepID=UPI002E81D371|nr:acyl-CoA dehydrogenase family protein [Streptomyces sp. NBC_00525]WUC96311.1 acyl-CoA dehydrogenase family protein [Streptomyces sp. NBC_00525]
MNAPATPLPPAPADGPAASLGEWLGDPRDPSRPFSYAASARWDRAEEFPAAAVRTLDEWGLGRHYVPAAHGGSLSRLDVLLDLVRVVARRDLTVAVAHTKTFLGSVCVWAAGTPEQTRALAGHVLAGAPVAWGLTERPHGSDLTADEFSAVRTGDGGYTLDGEKWLINNGTRSDLVCLLARTGEGRGPRDLSLLLLDKRRNEPGAVRSTPKIPTHGIRGADISGFTCRRARALPGALVGAEGTGLETVLRVLPVTRAVCTALSLGAADHALDLATEFAEERELYGRRVVELGRPARLLGQAYALAYAGEAVSRVLGRAAQCLPRELPVMSAVAKAVVPSAVDELIGHCAEVLGARSFLDGAYADGRFQKLERDHRIVGIFDGSTVVNRHALIRQFPTLVRAHGNGTVDAPALAAITDPSAPMPDLDLTRLGLVSSGGCGIVQGLGAAVARLRERAADRPAGLRLTELARSLLSARDALHEEMAALGGLAGKDVPPHAFDLARRYEWCFTAAAAVHLWSAGRDDSPGEAGPRPAPYGDEDLRLEAVLTLALPRVHRPVLPGEASDPVPGGAGDVFERLLTSVRRVRAGTREAGVPGSVPRDGTAQPELTPERTT